MREGSLEAPTRHPIAWEDPDFADLAKVEYAAVNGMLSTLDPHSILMDPEQARDMDVSTSGKFGGLGIVIHMVDRKLTVVKPMKDTPAWIVSPANWVCQPASKCETFCGVIREEAAALGDTRIAAGMPIKSGSDLTDDIIFHRA